VFYFSDGRKFGFYVVIIDFTLFFELFFCSGNDIDHFYYYSMSEVVDPLISDGIIFYWLKILLIGYIGYKI